MARAAAGGGGVRLSLRATFVLVALVCVLPFLALLAYFGYSQIGREKGRVQQEALSQARAVASQLEGHLTARVEGLASTAEAIAAGGATPATGEAQARRYRQTFADFDQVVVVDQVGAVLASVATAPGQEARRAGLGDQEWFKRAATSTQPFVGEPRQAGPDLVVGMYTPARTADGQFRGVVAADLNLRRFQDLLVRARLREGTVAEVVTDKGLVVARHPSLFLLQPVQGGAERAQGPEAGEVVFADGETRLAGVASIRPVGWTVAVGLPSAMVLAETRTLATQVAAGAAAVTLLALALALLVSGRTARGMERLRAAMSRLEAGDIPASVPITVGGEIGALTDGFNRVVGWLRNKLREYEALSQVEEAAGAALAGDRSVSAVLPDLLRKVVSGMAADAGVLVLQEDAGLVTKAAVGFGAVQTEGVTVRRGQGLAGAVMGGRDAILVDDVDADYRVEEPYIKAAGLRSMVAVPILSGDRVIGAVEVGYRNPHTFTDAEVQRLEVMARRTTQALEHERALDDVRRNTMGLEAKLAEQMEALQKAATEQAEARRQAQEARRQTEELQQTMRMQVSPQVQIKEVVRADPAAEEAKRVRVTLQKTVSEELRGPLTALLDLPRFLLDGINKPLGREEQQQLEILHTRGEEIIELIDNLVTLSGLHGGQVKVAKAAVNLPEVIQRVVRALQPRAAARGNRIVTEIKPEVTQLLSDAKRVEQILTNLIATSAKYTELGEIRVTCYQKGTEVVLAVTDDGVGFSPEEQAKLFEPFLQVGPRGARKLPGTGLLLTVCQRLVPLLGGKITVESEVDRGTWFTVTLPSQ
ncbi:MAG: GAF domain-containing protein [Candidatus Rokubacteria bacterium]|nr:GAF domain-containing protein [Candidatus Rokubacteria bacterium]